MNRTLLLRKATRIEGNADIHVEVRDGRVETARFVVQDFRGFEKMVQGRAAASVPHLVSRICGLCSTAHQVAGLRAVEHALGVETPPTVRKLRQIAVWGEWIASHALSYFYLTLPDALGSGGGIFDLMQQHPNVARDAVFMRRSGQRIVEVVGRRPVHPVALGVGHLSAPPTQAEVDEIRRLAVDVQETAGRLVERLSTQSALEDQIPLPATPSVNYLAYDGRDGQHCFRAFDPSGALRETFAAETFGERVAELRADWSLAKFPYLSRLGFPDGIVLVGPLSRLFLEGGVLDEPALARYEVTGALRDAASLRLDLLDECRLLEIVWAAKQIERDLDGVDLAQTGDRDVDLGGSGSGIGVVEAPRGVLVHTYTLSKGAMERMRLLVATQFNNACINLVLRDLADQYVDGDGLSEAGERAIARCVRVFDPCLTCATH